MTMFASRIVCRHGGGMTAIVLPVLPVAGAATKAVVFPPEAGIQ